MDIVYKLMDLLPNTIDSIIYNNNTKKYTFFVKKNRLELFLIFIKKSTLIHIEQLQDLFCIDLLGLQAKKRFQLNYVLLSISNNIRLQLKYNFFNNEIVKSFFQFFNSCVWLEREVWDLYGVFILQNPDLRRILTDYGFKGHALRKDFPLSGYVEIFYDIEYKSLLFGGIELMQEYRAFEYFSPWNTNTN